MDMRDGHEMTDERVLDEMVDMEATAEQLESASKVLRRHGPAFDVYRLIGGSGCILVVFRHITIGIEEDGHAHS